MQSDSLVRELQRDGVTDPAVLQAVARVPRERFVPPELADEAYENHPLPIGLGQTIPQLYIVAFMTEAAQLVRTSNVLEVGTGSGYQAAVLADVLGLGPEDEPTDPHGRLCSIEVVPELAERGERTLRELGHRGVVVRCGDGHAGWPARAPFDAILVTAAPREVPEALIEQLALGGRLVIPVWRNTQVLEVITKTEEGIERRSVLPVLCQNWIPPDREQEGRRVLDATASGSREVNCPCERDRQAHAPSPSTPRWS